MSVKQILTGHLNELLGRGKELSEARLTVCKACPLMKKTDLGPVCDSAKYLNPTTGEWNHIGGADFFRGCSCRLSAKTTIDTAKCPAGKW